MEVDDDGNIVCVYMLNRLKVENCCTVDIIYVYVYIANFLMYFMIYTKYTHHLSIYRYYRLISKFVK